jgi:hypothetical protein
MSEQAAAQIIGQIAAPVVAALLEDLHTAASAEITRLEATMPQRIQAAETDVQNWTNELVGAFHGLVARIDGARTNVQTATIPGPTAAPTGTSTAASAPTTAPPDATTKTA